MGEHKRNPNVQLALDGKLPQKKPKLSKRERERIFMAQAYALMLKTSMSSLKHREDV